MKGECCLPEDHDGECQTVEDLINDYKFQFVIHRCKRDEYIRAWTYMYLSDKNKYNKNPLFDEVNPSLNATALKTETDNFCVVAYDSSIACKDFKLGLPVGVFSFVVTPSKIIGKQFVVDPKYQGLGLGKAMLIENEKALLDNGYNKYYIGCSKCSASILKKYWGIDPFSSDGKHDLYKFNVDLKRENFNELYESIIENNEIIKTVE